MKTIEIEGEKVYLKKFEGRWRTINPIKIDGKINWKNLIAGGDWVNLIKIGFIVFVILGCLQEYSQAVNLANECIKSMAEPQFPITMPFLK